MGDTVLNDPQPTRWFILRPQEGFEQIYQGRPHNVPIPLFPYTVDGALALESERLRAGYDAHLSTYLQVARGSTLMMIFPRVQGMYSVQAQVDLQVQQYTYQLRWRQRPLDDTILSKGQKRYSIPNQVSAYSSQRRLVIPCSQGEVITPSYPENGTIARGIFTNNGVKLVDQQGLYDDANFRVIDQWEDNASDSALGPTCYPVHYTRCDGDELGIVAYRLDEDNWDFTGVTGGDWPFTYTYGVGLNPAGSAHPINPGAGVYVAVVSRSTTP